MHKHLYKPEGDGILNVDPGLARRPSPRDVLDTFLLVEGEVGVQVGDGGGVLALGTLEGLHQQVRQAVQLWHRELEEGGGLRSSLPTIKTRAKSPCELGPTREQVLLSLVLELFHKQVSTLPLSFSKKGDRDRSRAYIMYKFIKQLEGNTKKILVTLTLGYTL